MKPRRRVLVIARHFWPATNDDTLRLYFWAQHLLRHGAAVTVLTPRWHTTWPRRMMCNGVLVERLDYPPTHTLRFGSYARQLTQWLTRGGEFDLVYCDSPDADAATVLSQASQLHAAPVVVRCSELAEGLKARAKAIDVCRRASLILASCQAAQQQLLAAGVRRHCISRTPQVAGTCYDRTPDARRVARQVLGDANHDLFARSQDRVLVCPGELSRAWGIPDLIRELAPLIEEHRGLRVWILGDSRERPTIYQMLQHEGLHRLVAMPGIFTDLEEILQAADLCVFPAADVGLGWLLPTCIASSIPALVADSPNARGLLGDQAAKCTVRVEQPHELRGRVAQWLRDPAPLTQCMTSLRKYAVRGPTAGLGCDDLIHMLEASAERHA